MIMKREQIKTILDLFEYIVEAGAEYPLIYRTDNEAEYVPRSRFYEDVMHAGAVISGRVQSGGAIAMIGDNSYSYVVTYFGVLVSGNTPVMLDKMIEEKHLKDVVAAVNCSAIVFSDDYEDSIGEVSVEKLSFDEVLSNNPDSRLKTFPKIDENDICTVFLTSASTGKSKIVPLSHKNMVSEFKALDGNTMLSGTAILCLPLHHVYGLVGNLLYMMYINSPVFITKSIRNFLIDIKLAEPDILILVPALYSMIIRALKSDITPEALRAYAGPRLKYIVFGGSPFNADPSIMLNSGITPYIGYGLTETSSTITLRTVTEANNDLDNVGKPIGNTEIIIGEENEILVKSDMVFASYLNNDCSNDSCFVDGYFRTGDVGYIDDNGELHITGRIKNLIILPNGENIPAEMLEAHLYELSYVKECIVKEQDDKIIAVIYSEDGELTAEKIKDDIRQINMKLPVNCSIADYILTDKPFSKTSSQKIKRY